MEMDMERVFGLGQKPLQYELLLNIELFSFMTISEKQKGKKYFTFI
jgi:Cys-tRNA synthase (O-phospho-L-seryl-tRNA:Cys-tRNA synthase)